MNQPTQNTNADANAPATPPMQYRRFGRTGLQMPVFSCGGMRYQQAWQDVPLSEVKDENQLNLEATIQRSLAVGINHIETARGYGSSERQLGPILSKLPRDKMIIQTKIGPTDDPDEFTRNFEESLQRLQLDFVDLLAIHGINDAGELEKSIKPGGCLAKARAIQKRGLARHIGFSTHGPTEVIQKAINHPGDGGFDYVNLHWYFIYPKNWPAVLDATRHDMGVFIISPSDKGGLLYKPSEKLTELCSPLHPIVFNDLFCLNRPEIHTLSIGAARPSDFDRHLETLPLMAKADENLRPILARLHEAMRQEAGETIDQYFARDLPEWQDSPAKMNIMLMLWLGRLAQAYGMVEYGKMRYNLLGNGGHWFPGQNASKLDEVSDGELQALARRIGLEGLEQRLREVHALLGGQEVKRLSQSK